MAIGLVKNNSIIGIEKEVTEGVYVAPSGVNSFFAPLKDGFTLVPTRELVDRTVLTSSIGRPTPRTGERGVGGAAPTEFRASGLEGEKTDFDLLLESLLGSSRQVVSRFTTTTGHTTTVLNGVTVDSTWTVGDIFVILEAGDMSIHAVKAVDSTTLTYCPARTSPPSDAVELSKSTTYFPADSGHPTLSLSYFWGDEIRSTAIGSRVTSMSIDNFTTGQIASFNFAYEGLSYDHVDGSAPFTPALDVGLPPVILNACISKDCSATPLQMSEFGLNVENTVSFLKDFCTADGKTSGRAIERVVSGTLNPYSDDTTVEFFDDFDANTEIELFISAHTPSAVPGEIELGSVVGIYLPINILSGFEISDVDGIHVDSLAFETTRGSAGTTDEIFIGMV